MDMQTDDIIGERFEEVNIILLKYKFV